MKGIGNKKHDQSQPKSIRDRLWWVVISPSVWAVHFLACYLTVAIWCEKYSATGSPTTLGALIAIYTVIAVAVISVVAWASLKTFWHGDVTIPFDFDEPGDRTNFLGFTALLLSLLSLIATLFTVLAVVVVRSCD